MPFSNRIKLFSPLKVNFLIFGAVKHSSTINACLGIWNLGFHNLHWTAATSQSTASTAFYKTTSPFFNGMMFFMKVIPVHSDLGCLVLCLRVVSVHIKFNIYLFTLFPFLIRSVVYTKLKIKYASQITRN